MTDGFRPTSFETLVDRVVDELEASDSILGIPRTSFFVPRADHGFRTRVHGLDLDTPWGVAAGPHTQLAQNIVAAWLVGARVIELKTVQSLDALQIHRPCIDVADEGYNVEWSQELRVHESFDEYLRAWVLVHALHRLLGFPGDAPGVLFDMSVGYDLAGIRGHRVAWYLDAMADASRWLPAYVDVVARRFPDVREIAIPARVSGSVTLSTMHGCPPGEIERIALHLIEERGLDTKVKCNPTLLGADEVRRIVNDDLGYADVVIPDAAFGHDLRWEDAVPMFRRLADAARGRGVAFGLKLSNTLEVENTRGVFAQDPTMYMSGRALHPVTVGLAAKVAGELGPDVPLSFAGGVDCFNVARLLACGLRTVTACSDLLKTGGYLRMRQYADEVDAAMRAVGARDLDGLRAHAPLDLQAYAAEARRDPRYRKETYRTDRTKTTRPLGLIDCIAAPCVDECPVDQAAPAYMRAVRGGDAAEAVRIVRRDNPLPTILGTVCDHLCERTCVRTHLDEPVAIRHVKRFVMEQEAATIEAAEGAAGTAGAEAAATAGTPRVAIVGAGPAGLAAAQWLARAGVAATILEAGDAPGGMVGGAIPAYRLPDGRIARDIAAVERLGVEVRYGIRFGTDVTAATLREDGFAAVVVAAGAQRAKGLGIAGEDAPGVVDGVDFLRSVRAGRPIALGRRVAVVGAGDTAMDCARSARRAGAEEVSLVYRRTIDQMPADREEVHALREEGIAIVELARPTAVEVAVVGGRVAGLRCVRTAYGGDRDGSGRKVPHDVPGSDFTLPVDAIVVAIGQEVDDALFGADAPARTPAGWIATDPATLATSIPGVYAAGDAAGHGPASIVRAAADGKRAAAAIAATLGMRIPGGQDGEAPVGLDLVETGPLVARRAHRAYRIPVRTTPLDARGGFDETVLGYSAEEARREAGRCLDCDTMCSLCVSVCPNLALVTYATAPLAVDLPALAVVDGVAVPVGARPFAVAQRLQVAVVADLCNACGTCVTACPTAGRPHRDKPRVFLDRDDFLAEADDAFHLPAPDRIEGRFGGATHALHAVSDHLAYAAPGFRASLDRRTLTLLEGSPTTAAEGDALDLAPAALMATLLAGLARSVPRLPAAAAGGSGTRVAPPDLPG